MQIELLHCTITLRVTGKKPGMHRDEKYTDPAMAYALPMSASGTEGAPEPGRTATEERGAAAGQTPVSGIHHADARAVSDRVYELMREEIAQSVQRGVHRN